MKLHILKPYSDKVWCDLHIDKALLLIKEQALIDYLNSDFNLEICKRCRQILLKFKERIVSEQMQLDRIEERKREREISSKT